MPYEIHFTNNARREYNTFVIFKVDANDERIRFRSLNEANKAIKAAAESQAYSEFFDHPGATFVTTSLTKNGYYGTKRVQNKDDIQVWRLGTSYIQAIANGDDIPYGIRIIRS